MLPLCYFSTDKVDLSAGEINNKGTGEKLPLGDDTEDWAVVLSLHSVQVVFFTLICMGLTDERSNEVGKRSGITKRRATLSTTLLDPHSSLSTLQQ